ncbi:MAG: VWA domain-containing protein [Pseudomonadales bacterium]|nr:VWA domain-containing protein [Pseudomonadales bacterium]
MIQFAWPLALFLLPLPILVYYLLPAAKRDDAALRVPFFRHLASLSTTASLPNKGANTPFHLYHILLFCAWVSLVMATAKPEWIGDPISLPTSGRDLMIAVDISGSMKREDLTLNDQPVTRLAVVKEVLGDFIAQRKGDRIGLILFGTQAYLQAPLTFDRHAVETLLNESQIGFAGEQTAIGDAIGLATKRLRNRPETSRLLILLTDGANTAGQITPQKATEIAQAEQIKIYTIGVGASEMEISSPFGGLFGRRTMNPSADLDEGMLQDIAEQTGGQYFRAHNTQELAKIYAMLDQIEPIEQDAETFNPVRSLFIWPLTLFLLLSLIVSLVKFYPTIKYRLSQSSTRGLTDV